MACIWITNMTSLLFNTCLQYKSIERSSKKWFKQVLFDGIIEQPPDTKHQIKTIQQNKYKNLMKTILLVSSIPQFNLVPNIKIHNKLNGFLNAKGISQTNKIFNRLVNDLCTLISKSKIKSILPKAKVQTGGFWSSGCSRLFSFVSFHRVYKFLPRDYSIFENFDSIWLYIPWIKVSSLSVDFFPSVGG